MEIRVAKPDEVPLICELYNEFSQYNAFLQPEYYKSVKETGIP